MKKKYFLIFGFIVTGLFAGALIGFFTIEQNGAEGDKQHLLGSLSGFEPGTPLSYKIIPSEGEVVSGEAVIDEGGGFDIPEYKDKKALNGRYLAYNIQIDQDKGPLGLNFMINPSTKKISVSGSGFDEFSDITMRTGAEEIKTKTDWSGLVEELEIAGLGDNSSFGKKGFQIAFYNNNIASDAREQSPNVSKVFLALGGGGPKWEPLQNVFIPFCYYYDPELSVCDYLAMYIQILFIQLNYVHALQKMTDQFSAVMMEYVGAVGMFLDAKTQMETQRDLQKLQAEAHKDYHPSDQMCRFGSFIKSVARTEEKALHEKWALNKILTDTYANTEHASSAEGYAIDVDSRLRQFREVYCDPTDNNDGLQWMCDHDQDGDPATRGTGAVNPKRINKDVNFYTTAGFPLTLEIDFAEPQMTDDEEDVIALAKNLYWPRVLETSIPKEIAKKFPEYMNARRLHAVSNVAHNSFTHLVGMKSQSVLDINDSGVIFMKSLMREFGITDQEIDTLLGEYPSYYAQMEVLTKKIYQNPDFYTNLYDKPVNIDRINVSMEAIKLMQRRDWYEASLRREMLTSLLLEEALAKHVKKVNSRITSLTKSIE